MRGEGMFLNDSCWRRLYLHMWCGLNWQLISITKDQPLPQPEQPVSKYSLLNNVGGGEQHSIIKWICSGQKRGTLYCVTAKVGQDGWGVVLPSRRAESRGFNYHSFNYPSKTMLAFNGFMRAYEYVHVWSVSFHKIKIIPLNKLRSMCFKYIFIYMYIHENIILHWIQQRRWEARTRKRVSSRAQQTDIVFNIFLNLFLNVIYDLR